MNTVGQIVVSVLSAIGQAIFAKLEHERRVVIVIDPDRLKPEQAEMIKQVELWDAVVSVHRVGTAEEGLVA